MKAEYDSEADALSIDLIDGISAYDKNGGIVIDDDHCFVSSVGGRPANLELLYPGAHPEHLETLAIAADRLGLDREALRAAALSALAAPDRIVQVDVGAREPA